jgi:hypothetical protein
VRKACMIQTAIWQDDDFVALSPDAKCVYLMLLTQPNVSTCGVLSLRYRHWARLLGVSTKKLVAALSELGVAGFIADDPDTEELLIRTWVKHNVGENPKMVAAARDQYKGIYSERLKKRLVDQYPDVFEALDAAALIPDGYPIDTLSDRRYSETQNARGTRYEVRGTSNSQSHPKDLEGENLIEDSEFSRLLGVMGKTGDQQTILELRAFRGRGASEFDFESVRAGVEKTRPRYARAYVRKALEKRLAARGAA